MYSSTLAASSTPEIKSGLAGRCLDDYNNSSVNGTKVDSYGCNGTGAQQWMMRSNSSVVVNGKCLDVVGQKSANGTKVDLYACNGGRNQQWLYNSTNNALVSVQSDKCLDVPRASLVQGTQVQIWSCANDVQQKWYFASYTHANPTPVPPAPGPGKTPAPVSLGTGCEKVVLPAYWYPNSAWTTGINSHPAFLILDISGSGAGNAPDSTFQHYVAQAQAAGVKILGYDDTTYGGRAIGTVESEIQHYKSWYKVTDIFFDQTSSNTAQLNYYETLDKYVHSYSPGSTVMLNPGDYPPQQYMNAGDILMVFEDTYSAYVSASTPSWVNSYPSSRFVNTVHDTPTAAWQNAFRLAQKRHAGYVFITNGTGGNPYSGLPSYWSSLMSASSASCK